MFNQGRFEEGRNAAENLFKTVLEPIHEKLMVPLPFEIEHNKFIKWKKPDRYCSAIFSRI